MIKIQVKSIPESTASRLTERAKQLGYVSREDYLRDVLEKVANDEMIYHSDTRYEIAMTNLAEQIKVFGQMLYLNVQMGLLESPFEFDSEGNIVRHKSYSEIMAEKKEMQYHAEKS